MIISANSLRDYQPVKTSNGTLKILSAVYAGTTSATILNFLSLQTMHLILDSPTRRNICCLSLDFSRRTRPKFLKLISMETSLRFSKACEFTLNGMEDRTTI